MPKTCKTCESVSRVLKCVHGWPCYEGSVVCEEHTQRETLLVVDALAKALKQVTELSETLLIGVWPGPEKGEQLAVVEAAKAVLTRHQEEVGNAKA